MKNSFDHKLEINDNLELVHNANTDVGQTHVESVVLMSAISNVELAEL